jgi:hypothetical protein
MLFLASAYYIPSLPILTDALVTGPDLDEDWVLESNDRLAAKVAREQKAVSPSKKIKQPELGAATRTSTSPNAAKIQQRMKKHGGSAPRR